MQKTKKPAMEQFDQFAKSYDELLRDPIRDVFSGRGAAFFHERKRDLIRDWFRRRRRSTQQLSYLDVGCGKGELLSLLQKDFERVSGCDPSEEMLAEADCAVTQRQTDSTKIPFADSSFDFVTAVCVFHHVPPDLRDSLTRDIVRVLRPGGVFSIIEHNPWNPATRIIVSRTPVDADAILLPARESMNRLRNAGLRIAGCEYFLYFPEALYRYLGRTESLMRSLPFGGQYAVFAEKPPAK
ncbi:MAG TPA: class I SAM-dependent methyltransferase [Bryobacteraceae bacterium]|nr:class I SAM-dependent methyltransferase [Bryobacteraceae bacterium]